MSKKGGKEGARQAYESHCLLDGLPLRNLRGGKGWRLVQACWLFQRPTLRGIHGRWDQHIWLVLAFRQTHLWVPPKDPIAASLIKTKKGAIIQPKIILGLSPKSRNSFGVWERVKPLRSIREERREEGDALLLHRGRRIPSGNSSLCDGSDGCAVAERYVAARCQNRYEPSLAGGPGRLGPLHGLLRGVGVKPSEGVVGPEAELGKVPVPPLSQANQQ